MRPLRAVRFDQSSSPWPLPTLSQSKEAARRAPKESERSRARAAHATSDRPVRSRRASYSRFAGAAFAIFFSRASASALAAFFAFTTMPSRNDTNCAALAFDSA